jgi:hypothetical protein
MIHEESRPGAATGPTTGTADGATIPRVENVGPGLVHGAAADGSAGGRSISFRLRVTGALLGAALTPLLLYAAGVAIIRSTGPDLPDTPVSRAVLFALVGACLIAVMAALVLASEILNPIRDLAGSMGLTGSGRSDEGELGAEDALALIVSRTQQLAADLAHRDAEVDRVRASLARLDPGLGEEELRARIADEARLTFGLITAEVRTGPEASLPPPPEIPGDPRAVRASLGGEAGDGAVIAGTIQASRVWTPDDQLRLDLFAAAADLALAGRKPVTDE